MAHINFTAAVVGAGSAALPVTLPEGETIEVSGLGQVRLPFSVQNTLDRPVSFPALTVTVEGASKDKLTVSLAFDAMTLEPGAVGENSIIVEAREALQEGDSATITVVGEE